MEIHVEIEDGTELPLVQKVFIVILGTMLLGLIVTAILPITSTVKEVLNLVGTAGLLLTTMVIAVLVSS